MNKALKKKTGWNARIRAYLGSQKDGVKKQKAAKKKRSAKRKARRNNL